MYTIKQFYKDLEVFLAKSTYKPYESAEEGLVYFVDVIERKNLPLENGAEFALFLSYFVMLDLVFYSHFNDYYLILKNELKTPKFEHGLSGVYMGPQEILRRLEFLKINDNFKVTEEIFKEFSTMLNKFLENSDLRDLDIWKVIFKDDDLNSFSKKYVIRPWVKL